MRVLKFGGSSVAGATNISRVIDIVEEAAREDRVIVVSSAIKDCTDTLLDIEKEGIRSEKGRELLSKLRKEHFDIVRRLFTGKEREDVLKTVEDVFSALEKSPAEEYVTFGELLSTVILEKKLSCEGFTTRWLDSRELIVKGDFPVTSGNILRAVGEGKDVRIFIAPGFIAKDPDGAVTTLGRGGSDYSASIFAAACNAGLLEIWTDVPGIMTTNPKDVPEARTIPEISYRAALDMASHGAKVLYAPTVEPAMQAGIPICIRNTFNPEDEGTTITGEDRSKAGEWIGLTCADAGEDCVICLVREGDTDTGSTTGRIKDSLSRAGISTVGTATENGNILVTVRRGVRQEALKAIHEEFFETVNPAAVNLFIAGYGAVGKALVSLIGRSADNVAERTGKKLRITGLSDSGRFVIDMKGIDPARAAEKLASGTPVQGFNYIDAICHASAGKPVFVDCTDSETIYVQYAVLSSHGVNIVSSNRRAFAVPYVHYAAMHSAARQNGVFLRYETTVGAALPILESVSVGANSCDEILSMEAVVSCSLNQILGSYDPHHGSFASALRRAQEAGLTEPDPRTDLFGRDALRKLLILGREAGIALEEEDVTVTPVVDRSLADLPLGEFYSALEKMEGKFREDWEKAEEERRHLRFVASFSRDEKAAKGYRAEILVKGVDMSHPAYHISGTENTVIIRSTFHPNPLIIQGAGEGAIQAASSILNDILR